MRPGASVKGKIWLFRNRIGAYSSFCLLILLLGTLLLLAACGDEDTAGTAERGVVAKDGDSVAVHYHGTLDSGEVFDSSREREPLTFVIGGGQVISGFDDAVRGLSVGESIEVRLGPGEAYGERRDDLILEIPRDQAPEDLAVGDRVSLGNGAPAVVLEVTDETVRVDANHTLAGQSLTFQIELVSIQQLVLADSVQTVSQAFERVEQFFQTQFEA